MTSANTLEIVLRYALLHCCKAEQWIEPTKECLEAGSTTVELCDLLLTFLFSTTRIADALIEEYLTISIIGRATLNSTNATLSANNNLQSDMDTSIKPLIEIDTFITQLLPFLESTTTSGNFEQSHHWTFLLRLLSYILAPLDSDRIIVDLQRGKENSLVEILIDVFKLLSHILATGLYHDWYIKATDSTNRISGSTNAPLAATMSFQNNENYNNNNTQPAFDSQFSFVSQTSIDLGDGGIDATLDIDNTQVQIEDDGIVMLDNNEGVETGGEARLKKDPSMADGKSDSQKSKAGRELSKTNSAVIENAVLAAQIMIMLIEKKDVKRIFELQHNLKRQLEQKTEEGIEGANDTTQHDNNNGSSNAFEPWIECQIKLDPKNPAIKACRSNEASQNSIIQRALTLVQKLTDRDIERRMAVHMKYHELEDEGTARAMPSAGVMGLLYHMVQIRPSLDDDYILDHLVKLQTIKGSFDESFFLEIWLTALGGLREASLNTSCQIPPMIEKENIISKGNTNQNCNSVVATNRLLWKSIVLVKLPDLLDKLQHLKRDKGIKLTGTDESYNAFESALMKLEAFTGLINACSIPACCTEYYAPDSTCSSLVDKMIAGEKGTENLEAEDDFMNMINEMDSTADDLNGPILKYLHALSNNDIFTNIVLVCHRHGFVRSEVVEELLQKRKVKEQNDSMDIDNDLGELTPVAAVDQNIDVRFKSIKEKLSSTALLELIHIGLVSPIHLRKIIDFILALLKEKSIANDFYSLSTICDVLAQCPCSVDLILQLYTPQELLSPLENICNNWDPNGYQTEMIDELTILTTEESKEKLSGGHLLYQKYGRIWNFVISVVKRFKLYRDLDKVFIDKSGLLYTYFAEGPTIYGIDILDDSMEVYIENWMSGLAAGDELSEDLLKSSSPQILLKIFPSIIQRAILLYSNKQMDNDTFVRIISYFQKPVLDFTLSGIFNILCEELLNGQSAIALLCLRQYIMGCNNENNNCSPLSRDISLHPVLGSLESLLEFKRQEAAFSTTENEEDIQLVKGMSELMQYIHTDNKLDKLTEDHSMMHVETVTTGVIPSTLFEKASTMFRYIVKSGRSLYMGDVDTDTNALWDDQAPTKMQVVSHCLDMTLFETALEIGGGHWFVNMIVDQVLEAGRSGGAARAAELGSCLITTPLLYSANRYNSCINLLRCLLQDVLPSSLHHCAEKNMSYFQGQTLGVFTSDCLVLMQNRDETVSKLGKLFFNDLYINNSNSHDNDESSHRTERKKSIAVVDEPQIVEGTRFTAWDGTVTKSAVWRGFIKGLMSNPMIEEVWPNAFI
ncbi:hypothetical protein BDF20DRAFT_851010 [Mycotypha africana]|uniref:uncharacterized protein n=1 Tax=Mycotypha africana TaxID=64632 RepID=UPI0023005FD9|nr:uncharacterized protein BDF20DRAFT_851010 [Mycotypha africana]KAI8987579.1 hypothetical protein BDF20DRAFT_851010 [Mycotypha africana]